MGQLTDEVMTAAEEAFLKAELGMLKVNQKKSGTGSFQGRFARFISDNTTLDQELCLLDQNFVMDDSKTVAEYFADKVKASRWYRRDHKLY